MSKFEDTNNVFKEGNEIWIKVKVVNTEKASRHMHPDGKATDKSGLSILQIPLYSYDPFNIHSELENLKNNLIATMNRLNGGKNLTFNEAVTEHVNQTITVLKNNVK